MLSITFVSTPLALLSSRVDSVGAGGIGVQDNVQMSNADVLRTQFSPADALRAGLVRNASDSQDTFDNFVHGLVSDFTFTEADLAEAIHRTAEDLRKAAGVLSATQAPIDQMLGELQGAQQDMSSREQATLPPPETTTHRASLSNSSAQALYHSEPDKHL